MEEGGRRGEGWCHPVEEEGGGGEGWYHRVEEEGEGRLLGISEITTCLIRGSMG